MSELSVSRSSQSPYGRRGSCHFQVMNSRQTGFRLGELAQWEVLFCCDGQYFIASKVLSARRPGSGCLRAIHYATPSYFWFHMCRPAPVEALDLNWDPAQPQLAL